MSAPENPYSPPSAPLSDAPLERTRYAGFWVRTGAALIDTVAIVVVTFPLLFAAYGWEYLESTGLVAGPVDFLLSWVLPAVAVILFWVYYAATPGKMVFKARIVDAKTSGEPSLGQYIGRYLAYFVSVIPLGIGIIWVAFDRRKQG